MKVIETCTFGIRKMAAPTDKVPALRVSQLDATELDSEVISMVKIQLNKLFKYHQSNFLVNYDPEITALIKLLIWRFSIFAHEATIGQQILNLRYNVTASNQWMTRTRKYLYAAILIGCPWLKERMDAILHIAGKTDHLHSVRRCFRWVETGLKMVSILNFLVFLQRGMYQSLTERVLGIQPMFPNKQGIREVGFEFMTRELLWHGFSEFLFFILPLVNFQRIKNFAIRHILPKPKMDPSSKREKNMECAICGLYPVNPQEIGCQHMFCYYCVQSNYKSDPGFCCPLCGINIPSCDTIKPLRMVIEPS